ncbi:hypothetical protein ABPG74_013232 [Tetrahymena malaccensis]
MRDLGLIGLIQRLSFCENLLSLSLHLVHNKITTNGFVSLCQALVNYKKLKTLQLFMKFFKINDENITDIGSAFVNCKALQNLTLELKYNQIGIQGLCNLGTCLLQCEILSAINLNLFNNKIEYTKIQYFLNILKNLKHVNVLEVDLRKYLADYTYFELQMQKILFQKSMKKILKCQRLVKFTILS